MNEYYFSFRSLTQAHAARRMLQQHGIESSIVTIPMKYTKEGCNHSLKVSEKDIKISISHLHRAKLEYQKMFVIPASNDEG